MTTTETAVDESAHRLSSMHALLMSAIAMAGLTKDEACMLGLGLLADIIANAIPEPVTPERVADRMEELAAQKARFLRLAGPELFRDRSADLH